MLPAPIIAPSLLASNFAKLGQEVSDVIEAGADWMHLDIMDGHFVPNITFGADVIKALRPLTKATFDAHLMIAPYEPFIESFADAGCDIITIHEEAGPHLHRGLQKIRSLGKKSGVSINPATSVSTLEHIIDDVDLILIMSVNPGFGGQKFIPQAIEKVAQAKALIGGRKIALEVDGGVTTDNIGALATAGADVFVAGSAIFKDGDKEIYKKRIAALRRAAQSK